MKLLDVRPDREAHGSPGVVVAVDPDSFTVACGSGGLRVLSAQRPGKPRVSGGDFARGARLAAGARLA